MSADIIGVWAGALLTLLVFSYLLGDTLLFRFAQALFVGVTVGYATVVAIYLVLIPRLFQPLLSNPVGAWPILVPLVLGILLLLNGRTAWAPLASLPIAFLFGVGGALAVGGALSGALLPQINATVLSLTPFQGVSKFLTSLILVFGTVGALLSFSFSRGPRRPLARVTDAITRGWGYIGRWFILVAFGAIFAGTAVSRVSLLVSRVHFLLHDWLQVVP